jgi:hypothetical protein
MGDFPRGDLLSSLKACICKQTCNMRQESLYVIDHANKGMEESDEIK